MSERIEEDGWEMSVAWENAVVAGAQDMLKSLLKRKVLREAIPYALQETYRQWLIKIYNYKPEDIPWKKKGHSKPKEGDFVKIGTRLPVPCGVAWRRMVDQAETTANKRSKTVELEQLEKEAASLAYYEQAFLLREFNEEMRMKAKFPRIAKKKRETAVNVGKEQPPRTLGQAFFGPKAAEWMESATTEFDGLTSNQVVQHDFHLHELEAAGVPVDPSTGRVRPINLSIVLQHKYTDGILARYKTRMALAGHSGNMQKGVHYDNTFAASPNSNSSRLLQALMVHKGWSRMTWDITQAYLKAPLPPGRRVAIKYPEGFKR